MKKISPTLSRDVVSHYEKFVDRQRALRKPKEDNEETGYIG
jgi:hypothetical protein